MYDLDRLIEIQKEAATGNMHKWGEIVPVMLAILETDGEPSGILPLALNMPHSWGERDQLAQMARHALKEVGAAAYVFVSEIWIGKPMDPAEFERQRREGVTEEERPMHQADRIEGLVIHAENKRRERVTKIWHTKRDKNGKFLRFGTMPHDIEPTQFAGRFVGLLDERTIH